MEKLALAKEPSAHPSNTHTHNGRSSSHLAPTIFDEAHECLAQSLLLFLYADLRLLSATGRINTKYETLSIASDRVPRTSAAGLAQLPGMNEFVNGEVESVSPAQIMAILIVELRMEVIAQRRRAKEEVKRRGERGWFEFDDPNEDLEDDTGVMAKITDSKGRKEFENDLHAMIRTYNDMLRKDLKGIPEVKMKSKDPEGMGTRLPRPNLLSAQQALSRFMHLEKKSGNEKPPSTPSKFKTIRNAMSYDEYNRSNSSGAERSKRPFSKSSPAKSSTCHSIMTTEKRLDDLFEDEEKQEEGDNGEHVEDEIKNRQQPQDSPQQHEDVTPKHASMHHSKLLTFIESVRSLTASHTHSHNHAETMSDPGISSSRDEEPIHDAGSPQSSTDTPRKRPILPKQISAYIERTKEDHALYNKYLIPTEDYNTFTHAEDVGNAIFSGDRLGRLSMLNESAMEGGEGDAPDRNMNETELLDFMTKCISSRDDTKLSFMKDFFKEDSISRTMVKSQAKIVWMNDWYTVKDLMYAISVDKQKKRVTVVFRGAITRPDWNHAFDGNLKKIQNPVKDDYEGKSNIIRVHRGFYTYLMRVRKDTGTRKYDEIANKAYEYGSSMIGDDFNLFINGYSLGGGLGVLFGFHASTDERLTRNGPIKIFTYGMPYIASHSFADAFRHQERNHKVQHARIYNSNDIVAHIPFNLRPTKKGSSFVHLGIDVKLYSVHKHCSCIKTKPPRFHYNKEQSPAASYWKALKMNALLNMPLPWKIRDKHGLPELQMRLKRALTESEKAKDPMLSKTLDEAYDHLVHRSGTA